MAFGYVHAGLGMGMGAIVFAIGTPWGLLPMLPLALLSHMIDDWNVGELRVEHMVEKFNRIWQKFFLIMRIIMWLGVIAPALIILYIKGYWQLSTYMLGFGAAALWCDMGWPFNRNFHKWMLWKFWKTAPGAMTFYGGISICMIALLVIAFIRLL